MPFAMLDGDYPDFRADACAQVKAARKALLLEHEAFAVFLERLLGWNVSPGVVKRWETSASPPGDVVLAAAWMAGQMREPATVTHLSVVR